MHDLASIPDRAWYDPGAAPGSEANPVRLDGGQPVQRSAPVDELGEKIARAEALRRDPDMQRRVKDWHRREIARRQPAAHGGEITRVVSAGGMGQLGTLYGEVIR